MAAAMGSPPGMVPSWRLRIYLITASLVSARSRWPWNREIWDHGDPTNTLGTRGHFAGLSLVATFAIFSEHTRGPNLIVDNHLSGWWFGTFFIFPYIWNNHPN